MYKKNTRHPLLCQEPRCRIFQNSFLPRKVPPCYRRERNKGVIRLSCDYDYVTLRLKSKYTIVSFLNVVNTCVTTFFKNCFTSVPGGSDWSTVLLHMDKTCIAHLTIVICSMALGLPYSKCLHEVYEPMLRELRI